MNLHPLAEARAVVVARRLCVAKGLEHGVRREQLVLHAALGAARRARKVEQAVLGRLRLAGARLARNDDALVVALDRHAAVRRRGNGEHVRVRVLARRRVLVLVHALLRSEDGSGGGAG